MHYRFSSIFSSARIRYQGELERQEKLAGQFPCLCQNTPLKGSALAIVEADDTTHHTAFRTDFTTLDQHNSREGNAAAYR